MIYFIIFVLIIWVWMLYEFCTAPCMDNDGNIIKKKKNGK